MAIRDFYSDVDLKANQLFNSRLHNITTAARVALGLGLTTSSKGYMVYDTDLSSPYFWNGTQWLAAGGGGTTWGSITGTLTAQTDLTSYLTANYYPLSSNPAGYLTTETDPVFSAWLSTPPNISIFNNDSGYLSSVPTLQQVTDAGRFSTNSIVVGNYGVPIYDHAELRNIQNGGLVFSRNLIGNSSGSIIGNYSVNGMIYVYTDDYSTGISGISTISPKIDGTYAHYNDIYFPDASGTLALKVNGQSANDAGEITIPVGIVTLVALPFTTDHITANSNSYIIGDVVYYLGNVYKCIANNDSILPTSPLYWTNLGTGFPLIQQPIDWNSTSGNNQILNKPTIPTVGTWGGLNYPIWTTGTPFVKMTAAGTFALDTTSYQPLLTNPVTGTGTTNYVPKWSSSSALTDSQIFDNGSGVGIGTATPLYKLDVNGTGRFVNDLYADEDFIVNNYFAINTTATVFPIPAGTLGIWRRKGNGFGTYFLEDEQGGAKDKWAFVQRAGYSQTRDWYQTNSSIVDINYGWGNPNSSNYQGATLLIDPTINITNALITGTVVRGLYYNPTLTSLTNTTHIAYQNTSGDIIHGNLATGGADEMVTVDTSGKLKKQTIPAGGGGGTVTSVATAGLISGGTITTSGTISTSINTNKLVGRSTAGTGVMEEITVGSGLTLTGAGILNNTATPTPLGYYGAFSDVTDQFATVINVGYPMLLGVTDLSNQVTIVSGSRVTIANTGIYNIQWSGQFRNPTANEHDVTIWLRKNGVDVPGSAGIVLVPKKHGSFDGHNLPSWNYLIDPIAGDYYEFVWSTQDLAVFLSFDVSIPPAPSTASLIVTVTQQSGIMAGTGITAINSLTGSAQTIVTGTSGTNFTISSTGTTHTLNLPDSSATSRGVLTSADWNTFNGKQNALTNPVTGTGVSTRVAFWDTGSSLSSNTNLFWDNTNSRLGIGTPTPVTTLDVLGKVNINYSATTDFPLVIKNTNAAAVTSNVLSLDCSATGADQPVFVNFASSNPKGMAFFASNLAITGTPVAAGFQMYSTASTNFPGQMYFDSGANSSASLIFRTAITGGTIAQRMRIFANGNVSVSSSATNPNVLFNVAGVSQATQFKLSALNTAPATATSTGTLGEIRIVNGAIYVCVATNTWQRALLTTF